jgi:hypothetical protein
MNAKHTPGPWTAQTRGTTEATITAHDGGLVADLHSPWLSPADIRLIAAAPDLLAALADLVELHHDWEPGGRALKSLVVSNDKFIAAARAAIARATAGGVK